MLSDFVCPITIGGFIQYYENWLDELVDMSEEKEHEDPKLTAEICYVVRVLEELDGENNLIEQNKRSSPGFADEVRKDVLNWCLSNFLKDHDRYN